MKICVIGTGYVGLVAAACFAEVGNSVRAVDIDEQKIASLSEGHIPIYEPGLQDLVVQNQKRAHLSFSTDIESAVENSDVIFIAVGTPSSADGSADLKYVLAVAETIGRSMSGYTVIVTKSTVPVGTADKVKQKIMVTEGLDNADGVFDVVSNPEFMKEGDALSDFLRPDRVIIGAECQKAFDIMSTIYAPFVRKQNNIIKMDIRSAELTKYAANAMLAARISFMNEIARLCERVDADIDHVRQGIGSDARIGYDFLYPGLGYGGSCFPKDVRALLNTGRENQLDMHLISAVDIVNERQKSVLVEKVLTHYGLSRRSNDLKGKHFAIYGLSFKANTDDVRESGALAIIDQLLELGATISAYDPQANEEAKKIYGDKVSFYEDMYSVLAGVDALIIATEWNEFRQPEFDKIVGSLSDRVIFDGRNLYSKQAMLEMDVAYYAIGKGSDF